MSGISIGCSHPRPCSGRKTLRKGDNNVEADNVILIDVDSDHFDNVIIIDVPESLKKKFRGSSRFRKDKKCPFRTVIYIDDDEGTENNCPGIGVNDNTSFSNGASGSRKSCPSSKESENAANAVGEECQFVQENVSPVRLSKCKRTYSGNPPTRTCYGLNVDSDTDLSGDDYPDCDLMEDTSGKLQEQWEKAFFRRKKDKHNGQYGVRDRNNTSRDLSNNHQHHVRTESNSAQHKEAPFCSTENKSGNEREAPSAFTTKEYAHLGSASYSYEDPTHDDFSLDSLEKAHMQHNKSDVPACSCSGAKYPPFNFAEQQASHHYDSGIFSCQKEKQNPPASSDSPDQDRGTKKVNNHATTIIKDDEETPMKSSCGKASLVDEEASMCKHQNSFKTDVDHNISTLRDKVKKFQEVASGRVKETEHLERFKQCATSFLKEKENLMSEKSSSVNFSSPNHQVNVDDMVRAEPVSGETFFCKDSSLDPGIGIDKSRKLVPEIPSTCNRDLNEEQLRQDGSCSSKDVEKLNESRSNSQRVEKIDDMKGTHNGDSLPAVVNCIIIEREKLKETDEYKRAIEEEWASRQQALKIQAEEAQRLRQLRKRKKAESMRLLDMERRQKQRVEEIRESQKMDEVNMNLKEVIRTEVRTELNKLEIMCHDMASLLHSLGIQVASWPHPSPHEVQSAYKRALLTFHPDRASQSGIRQQVEAEEKFKLINRLKDKFSPTPRH